MLPYRTTKPHAGTDMKCALCTPTGPGHQLCQGCDEPATTQTKRHATDAEYAAIPPGLASIDSVAHQAVYGCDDCAETGMFTAFCTHPEPAAAPCPKCHAVGEQPCTAKNGDPRFAPHTARALAQPAVERCTHAHRADCPIFTGCQCSENDTPPVRPKRPTGDVHWPDMTQMRGITPVAAQAIVADAGIAWHSVAALRSKVTQIGSLPILEADVYQTGPTGDRIYDGHGKAVTEAVEIPLPVTTPGQVG